MSDWALAAYEPVHRDGVLRLMKLVQGHATRAERFQWEFEDNPTGPLNIQLALVDGQVIGVACHNTFPVRLPDGSVEAASFPLNVMTDPGFQRRGIFTALERACEDEARERGHRLLVSFPNRASTGIFLAKLGWRQLQGPRLWVQPIKPARVASAALRRPPATTTVPARATRIGNDQRRRGLNFQAIERFSADDVCERTALPGRLGIDHNLAYLNWRFADGRAGTYDICRVSREGAPIGWVVSGLTTKRSVPISYVAAVGLDPGERASYVRIRAAVLERYDTAARVDLDANQYFEARENLMRGYVPLPRRLNLIYKTADAALARALETASWSLQLADLDFF